MPGKSQLTSSPVMILAYAAHKNMNVSEHEGKRKNLFPQPPRMCFFVFNPMEKLDSKSEKLAINFAFFWNVEKNIA